VDHSALPVDHSALDPVDNVTPLCPADGVQEVSEGEGVVEFKLTLPSVEDGPEDVGVEEGEVDSEDELQSLLCIKNTTVDVFVI